MTAAAAIAAKDEAIRHERGKLAGVIVDLERSRSMLEDLMRDMLAEVHKPGRELSEVNVQVIRDHT